MLRRFIVAATAVFLLATAGAAWSYDEGLAESYAKLFEPVAGEKAGKALHLMKAQVLIEKVKAGLPIVTLDIRTPAETSVFTSALPGALTIPISELFTTENLARVPTIKTLSSCASPEPARRQPVPHCGTSDSKTCLS